MHLPVESLFKLTVYSHFFKINLPKTRIIQLALKFCYKYITSGFVKDRNKPIEMKVLKVFAARTRDNNEFRFHIGQLPEFMKMLDYNFITSDMYDVEIVDMYHAEKFNFKLKPHFVLRDYQEDVIDFIVTNDPDDNHSRLVCLPTGTGKSLPLDAPIKIPGGWSTMGDMVIGSVITGKDGRPTKVTGTYPQGIQNIFEITFSDGRTAECTLDHLWKIYIKAKEKISKVVSTKEIIRLLSMNHYRNRCYIDLPDSECNPSIDLPLDPYILGIFLGDGCLRHGTVMISTPDEFILKEIKNKLPPSLSIKHRSNYDYHIVRDINYGNINEYYRIFKALELSNKLSYEKHIPAIYLNGSTEQRLSLLQGLLDSDGTIDTNGTVSFCSTSIELAKGVQYLVRSLGGLANISIKHPTFTYKGEKKNGRDAYQVNIRYKKQSELFRLPKKKDRTNDNNQYANGLQLRIESIKLVSKKEAMCIAIDNADKLFITKDFIPTHNTLASLASITEINTRTVVLVLPSFMDKWAGDVTNTIDVKPKEIMLVRGSDQLKGVIDLAVDNTLTSKFIIISLTTIQNFFKAYEENNGHIEDLGYGCAPEDLYKILKVGTIIIDETHLHIHAVFKTMLYTHVNKIIALSATLISDDPMISRIHRVMFPKEIRFDKVQMKKYIKVRAISHRFYDYQNAKIRTTQYGSNVYSHGEFEKSVIKNRSVFNNYLKLIDSLIESGYIQDYIKGDKLAIFAASVNMCTRIVDHIKMKYPQFDTRRYVEEDPYKNIIEADIRVTTILSGGTAIDIPKLRVVIMLVNVQSPVSNLQTLGRLRELPDRDVKFYYVYSEQIPKQVEYHRRKMDLFADRSLSIKDIRSNIML